MIFIRHILGHLYHKWWNIIISYHFAYFYVIIEYFEMYFIIISLCKQTEHPNLILRITIDSESIIESKAWTIINFEKLNWFQLIWDTFLGISDLSSRLNFKLILWRLFANHCDVRSCGCFGTAVCWSCSLWRQSLWLFWNSSLLIMFTVTSELVVVLEHQMGIFKNISLSDTLNEGHMSRNSSRYFLAYANQKMTLIKVYSQSYFKTKKCS